MAERPYMVVDVEAGTDAWKEARRKFFTASEISILLGEMPWPRDQTADEKRQELYRRKRTGEDIDTNHKMLWGDACEELNGKIIYEKALGMKYRQSRSFLASKDVPFLGCTLDGFVYISPEWNEYRIDGQWFSDRGMHLGDLSFTISDLDYCGLALAELKQTSNYMARHWEGSPPRYNWWQAQAQMLVTGVGLNLVAGRIGAADARVWAVPADPFAQDDIIAAVRSGAREMGW